MTNYEIKDIDLAGRIARIKTRHGFIETPYLFPVVDPLRQEIPLGVIEDLGFNAIITNAYLFYRRNKGVVKSIHRELKWNKIIMTDSGGYQILVYGDVEVDNKTIVSYEKNIGVDIGVILDIPTGSNMSYSEARSAVEETFKRAVEVLPDIQYDDIVWVLPIQGAPYNDLVVYSSIRASAYPYKMYALGSPTVFLEKYEYKKIIDIVALTRQLIPPDKPLHVFGVGHPMIIPFLVALGADTFDSASYILYARDNRYMTEGGTKRLEELNYFPCSCPVCSRYTPKEMLELSSRERTKLLALHNLYKLREEINRVRIAIKEGRLWELIEAKSRMHPSLRTAYEALKKHLHILEKHTPLSKGALQALLLYDYESTYNPKLRIQQKHVIEYFGVRKLVSDTEKLILVPALKKPYREQPLLNKISYKVNQLTYYIIFYHPLLGIIPWDLSDTYPYFQHEETDIAELEYDSRICNYIVNKIELFLKKNKINNVELIVCSNLWWSKCLLDNLEDTAIKELGIKFNIITCT